MRVAVWCAAFLALFAVVASSALRTTQVEGVNRSGRRLSLRSDNSSYDSSRRPDEVNSTSIRPRSYRRREDDSEKNSGRKRTRSKLQETTTFPTANDTEIKPRTERNERFSSRKTFSRTRSSPKEVKVVTTTPTNTYTIRHRMRQSNRKAPTPISTSAPPNIDESKIQVINSNLEDIAKMSFNDDKSSLQFKRRSSTAFIPENENSKRLRGKINSAAPSSAPDLDSLGTTNDISVSVKEPTTTRNIGDFRSSRKLRYKTRLTETDSNLTGEGFKAVSNEDKSSQNNENIASQQELLLQTTQSNPPVEITEPSTTKRMRIFRHPLNRATANIKPTGSLSKKKLVDEISEDDNYPESFKALLQAKNASTHPSSQSSESLSVKASQVVYNTYTPTLQSNNTELEKPQNTSRFRNKSTYEDKTEKILIPFPSNKPDTTEDKLLDKRTYKRPEYKSRPTFTPRSRKNSLNVSTTTSNSRITTTDKPQIKYTRKYKLKTEFPESSTVRQSQTSNFVKKPYARPSYYSRQRNSSRSTERNTNSLLIPGNKGRNEINEKSTIKPSSYRTSYYSRFRKNRNNKTETTTDSELSLEDKEMKSDKPITFSTITTSVNDNSLDTQAVNKSSDEVFIIAVASKESEEKIMENEVMNIEVNAYGSTTPKYHSNFKDFSTVSKDSVEEIMVTSGPSIRNLHTKKNNYRQNDENDKQDLNLRNEAYLKQISESYSKSSTPLTNGITQEPEKSKSRYSAKYKAMLLEKPFYKATVPTVTPSTAWLKFFVTDRELIKTVQDPDWFVGDQLFDATTESMPRQHFIQTSPFIHDSSIELVEGEENQLGLNTNSISFTQTRPTLFSADLRLSESVVKSSHLMNVEASNHSPSVTVSIFDALADILTSTPRPRLSSTTEVTPKSDIKFDVKQTLKDVSNNINNVNIVQNNVSSDTSMSFEIDITTETKPVQITGKMTQNNVINRLRDGQNLSPSVNEELSETTLRLPQTTPIPTTPISARRPFAIKVLYSATESSKDMTSTTLNPSSTDKANTVHTIQSDILASKNNVVSSELTSMLSNNIKNILNTMDEDTRAKISINMETLLKSIIPRAISGISSDVDFIPETTPYSMEAIKDTEININFNTSTAEAEDKIKSSESSTIQTVMSEFPVNSVVNNPEINTVNSDQTTNLSVNISETLIDVTSSPLLESGSETLQVSNAISSTTEKSKVNVTGTIGDEFASTTTGSLGIVTEIVNRESATLDVNTTNIPQTNPIPFFTNFKMSDFTLEQTESSLTTEITTQIPPIFVTVNPDPLTSQTNLNVIDTLDSSKVSPLQLWVLSKKANVLKMIEDIIKQHYTELAYPPNLIQNVSEPISVSQRLLDIMNNMNTTTKTDESNLSDTFSTVMTTSPVTPPHPTILSTSNLSSDKTEMLVSTTDSSSPISSTEVTETLNLSTESYNFNQSTSEIVEISTSLSMTESTTIQIKDEETTVFNLGQTADIETTTPREGDIKTQSEINNSTIPVIEKSFQNNNNSTNSSNNTAVAQTIRPKKDFVIFGILPNNTVVRKDPNDDVLETLTEASPYIVYGVLPNNTIIRKFPNGTRVPRVMQKIDILPISPWSLRNPYSPIHNNPAIVRPQFNPIRASTNLMTSTDTSNNEVENRLTTDTVNNQQTMISSSKHNIKDSSTNSLGFVTTTNKLPTEKSTASHVLSLRTTTMLPSIDEILLNSISSATKQEMIISSMTSSTSEPRILTLDIDPETKQIRTEKPRSENMNAVFKFIPIDEVTVQPQNSNVLKLATKVSTATTSATDTPTSEITMSTDIEINSRQASITETDSTQLLESTTNAISPIYVRPTEQNNLPVVTTEIFSAPKTNAPLIFEVTTTMITAPTSTTTTTEGPTISFTAPTTTITTTEGTTITAPTTTTNTEEITTSNTVPTTSTTEILFPITTSGIESTTTEIPPISTTSESETTTIQATDYLPLSTVSAPKTINDEDARKYQENALLLQNLLTGRNAKNFNDLTNASQVTTQKSTPLTTEAVRNKSNVSDKDTEILIQSLLKSTNEEATPTKTPNIVSRQGKITTAASTTTIRSIEDDIKQFEEDTKLLKALLQATGQNPANFNIPSLNTIISTPSVKQVTSTTSKPIITTNKPTMTTPSIEQDIKRFQEDAQLLQALLQATGQTSKNYNRPVISNVTSNVRISSKPPTTTIQLNPPTTVPSPVYIPTSTQTVTKSVEVLPLTTTFQPRETTENFRISTTYIPIINQRRRFPTTTVMADTTTGRSFQRITDTGGRQTSGVTTDVPSTSTFSVEEDVAFLKNLKSVLNTNNIEDPETALANRIIALAVEKSLNEITTTKNNEIPRDGKAINIGDQNRVIPSTTARSTTTSTTTTTTTTTTLRPTTTLSTPSIEDDIKQFQEDSKLLQALLKATGQDPSKFQLPTLADAPTTVRLTPNLMPKPDDDLKLLSNLLASPSPLNESFNTFKPTKRPAFIQAPRTTSARPFGAKIAVKDDYKNIQDEAKLLNTLIKLQGVGDTTTQLPKLTATGQTSNVALKLLQRTKQTNQMVSEATQAPMSLSTEYGKSQDALLAALLKEQGFGPSTASSLDEQLRLAALLNQVVVTPKARRTTTPPPPPPPPRRPILDGLAWLWQQWRETAPGPGGPRPSRKPTPSVSPSASNSVTSSRVNWFGSGPFVGNTEERPTSSNRVPLEPPAVVTAEQTTGPGRGQLVSAAINVTRAFSQFLGAAIQGAAQTVQSVIRAGQRVASDVYVNGSG